jgi:cyclohexadienyl dehydratase
MRYIALILLLALTAPAFAAEKETAYDRVIKTQTIRCGYNYYEPVIWRDNETNELKGIYVEYMEALGKATGLKIEWAQEIGWADVPAALQADKVDAFCAGTWADAKRGVQTAFTKPVFYNAIEIYAREGDTRFDKDLNLINDPSVTIVTLDGAQVADIAAQDFTKAKTHALPSMGTDAEQLLNVANGKGDITFTNHGPALSYMKANPGKIRRVAPDKPLRVFSVTTAVNIKEQELLTVLNAATDQLHQGGMIDKILDKYEKDYPGAFTRVAKPYELKK